MLTRTSCSTAVTGKCMLSACPAMMTASNQASLSLLQVLHWEHLHPNNCGGPKLKRFMGRPQEYSPKARLLNFLGYKLPFDRHDWVVDRCGKEVR